MDLNFIASEIERASIGLQDDSTRKEAEEFLTNFAKLPDALLVCKLVLDQSQNALALFHAASTIKRRIAQDFFVLPIEDVVAFRDYLFGYCLKSHSILAHTSSTLLQSVAVICKFGWLRDGEAETSGFLNNVLALSFQADHEKHTTFEFVHSLLEEFSENNAIQYGLSNEMHRKCRMQFEKDFLLRFFLLISNVLQNWLITHPNLNPSLPEFRLGIKICKLLELLFSWHFIPESRMKDLDDGSDIEESSLSDDYIDSSIRRYGSYSKVFPDSWKPYVSSPEFLNILFEFHDKFERGSEDSVPLDQVIIALSRLDRQQLSSAEARFNFTRQFFFHISSLITKFSERLDKTDPHLITIAQMLDGILCSASFSELANITGFQDLIEKAVQLTLGCLKFAPNEQDIVCSSEALDILLDTWSSLVGQASSDERVFLANAYSDYARGLDDEGRATIQQLGITIFDAYVTSRLDYATQEIHSGLKEESIYRDWILYEDQMVSVATIARVVPFHSVYRIHELLVAEFADIQAQFKLAERDPEDLSLQTAYERVHWLLIISGYIMVYTGTGEEASIPTALNNLSAKCKDPSLDPIVQLPSFILSMLEFLTFHPNDVKCLSCSAELTETFFWFIERWAHTYLFPNKEGYVLVSNNILQMFGTSSYETAGRLVLDLLLDKIWRNFQLWAKNTATTIQIARVLIHLVFRKESRLVLFNSSKFIELSKTLIGSMENSGEEANIMVIQSILFIATGTSISETRQELLALVVAKFEEQLGLTLASFTHGGSHKDACELLWVRNILQLLRGFAMSNDSDNCLVLFNCYQKHLPATLDLVLALKNHPEVWVQSFRFLNELTKNLDLFDFDTSSLTQLNQFVRLLIQNYTLVFHDITRSSVMNGVSEAIPELADALEVLCNLCHLDNALGEGEAHECVLDLVFFGMTQLFPLISIEGLKFPDLSYYFFTLIALVAEIFPDHLLKLDLEFLASIMNFLTFAQENFSDEAAQLSFSAVFILALHAFKTRSDFMAEHLSSQLQNIMCNLIYHKFNSSLVSQASDALLVLLLVLPAQYQTLKENAASHWAAPGKADLLRQQFDVLFEAAQNSGKLIGRGRPALDVHGFNNAVMAFIRHSYNCLSKST
ncbi:hypothetical protein DSO57_1009614 [Entomophthora muscae]|uniref:Uncharacterized protein n=1 Tax=Entomophthora muscae TaxID=34485 RepID=A0ACC2SJI8_9FUNG|nr:hypothetical protein DSO57_1009614 [Entomophthora muscae]